MRKSGKPTSLTWRLKAWTARGKMMISEVGFLGWCVQLQKLNACSRGEGCLIPARTLRDWR